MSELDLDAIEARANAARIGPWHWAADGDDDPFGGGLQSSVMVTYNHGPHPFQQGEYPETVVGATGMHTEGYVIVDEADAEFIAHAREDVPALVAEVRRLRAEVIDLELQCSGLELEILEGDEYR